ncbi:uncharacterized protein MELLADRAFT_105605 [Melampsora larici-populina 98AG31]|uniref:Uncharacterized protein n=1 Tax=Melampsora larici-populina (strain 98AG31 / pathotype 3-4-7) TaxID=747676 RepID=F4RIS3_MELLP|nr:uncharacterized protein MELLADRAFT_105605 [Melampsora larici-populina 98AG31]EGG07781.1 hypothetical protein MELLADRAFT_105605 [Melampsora larici-populina 98AG31]
MISFSICTFTPSERPIEGIIEEHNLDGLVLDRVGQEHQSHRSTLPTPPPPMEMSFDDVRIPEETVHLEGNKEPKNDMQERIKALENFVTLDEEFKYETNPRPLLSILGDMVTSLRSPWVGTRAIGELCTSFERYLSRMKFMLPGLMRLNNVMGVRIVTNEQLEKIMVDLLEFLQQEDLELYERLWSLSVLRNLQFLLPIGKVNPIREDPNTGGVCRGGLELFLLKADRTEMISAVTEALKRVELIVTIKNYLLNTEGNLQTPGLIKIHDQLLQNRSLTKAGIIKSLASQSVHHTFLENTPDGEIECYSRIMEHLELFYPAAKQFGITEGSRRFKLITKIRTYLQDFDRNPQTHAIKTKYNKLLHTKSMDDALIVRSLVLESLQHMNIKKPDEDVECLYDILQYLETLHPNSEPFKITEPLERVQLIMNIRNYLHEAGRSLQTTAILNIHNTLLKTSSLYKPKIAKLLASQCMDHIVLENAPHEEVQCLYHILKYLKKFHSTTVPLIKTRLSSNGPFRKVYRKFKSQAELQPHLQRYFEKEDKDPYIMGLLLPFIGWHSVELSYVKHCLHILNIQDTALASNKGELYGLDVRKGQKYHEDQDFFIEMMYKASVYIEGLQTYLDLQVPRNGAGQYEFISSVPLANQKETPEKCQICLGGYLEGQRVVKLGCYRPHLFHEQCINVSHWICGFTHNKQL